MKSSSSVKNGLLPAPPMPEGLPKAELTENGRQVLVRRYLRRGLDGKPIETIEEMFWRVAYHVAKVEELWGGDVMARAIEFYHLLVSKKFFPNSPTFTGAGTPLGQLAACFVLPISDDMGRRESGIFQTLRNAALIQQTGGGNGFSFSRLRPKGTIVQSSAGEATGPVGFLRVYDKAFGEIAQGGTRRGANMAVLRVDHPDIEEFITCKTDENAITNFNISVGITDAFMRAVENDEEWELRFPDVTDPRYRDFDGTLEQAEAAGLPIKVYKRVRARELFDKIVRQAHHNGEPGVLFLDAANRTNPVPHLYPLEATNPCFIGDTRIATSLGLIPIRELAEWGVDFLVATDLRAPWGGRGLPNSQKGIVYRPASPAWKTRENAPVLRLITRHGYSVVATPDHKFLTPDRGYVELKDLRPGDKLLLQSGAGVWSQNVLLPDLESLEAKVASLAQAEGDTSAHVAARDDFFARAPRLPRVWSHGLGVVLGTLTAAGWLNPDSDTGVGMVFSPQADELLEIVEEFMQEHFGQGRWQSQGERRALTWGALPRLFFESLGMSPLSSREQRVPASIWKAPRPAVVGFLQGLFTAKGVVHLSATQKTCSIRLPADSLELLQEVQLLLLNSGIVSRIQKRRASGYREQLHAPYELILEKENRDRFLSEIGFLDTSKQQKAQAFAGGRVGSWRESFETTVAAIEDAGTADVYDLTEMQTHSVIANGIVAHQCGEQWLGPYENCCLGSVNLNEHCGPNGTVDWETLRQSVETATRFLDDVVEANAYVPSVPQLKEAAHRARRIGLGIMGLADLMYHVGVRYGSEEGQEFAAQVMEFIRYHAMRTSIQLAQERGPFPAIRGSIYDPQNLKWQPPQSLVPYRHDWGRPPLNWQEIVEGILRHGIRNAAQTTIAPTGTIATVAGAEGYGCEPVFALAYIRHVNDKGRDLQLTYASARFERALNQAGIPQEKRQEIFERVLREGTCQNIPEIPEHIRHVFVVAGDISAEEHVRMQAALQAFVDNSISKTINFPEHATVEDVATAYRLAWKLGCKGLTVYVTGSREKVVLETKATAEKKQGAAETAATPNPVHEAGALQPMMWHEPKKPRPRVLPGRTYSIETPLGKAFITINENGSGQPFEVFINTSKAGSETAAVSEAIGRLISFILRLSSPVAPLERVREIVQQLTGIGGGRSLGFGPNRVRSLPDGVGQVLEMYLHEKEGKANGGTNHPSETPLTGQEPQTTFTGKEPLTPSTGKGASLPTPEQPMLQIGDLCPECGEAALVNEEGCRKCYACGYSEC
jgi:ribonucleoside-diphosphate reductase alpha chain